jgi:hypothetical protein
MEEGGGGGGGGVEDTGAEAAVVPPVTLRLVVDYPHQGANRNANELSRNFDRTLDATLGALVRGSQTGFHSRDVEGIVAEALREWARGLEMERYTREGLALESPRSEGTSGPPARTTDSSDPSNSNATSGGLFRIPLTTDSSDPTSATFAGPDRSSSSGAHPLEWSSVSTTSAGPGDPGGSEAATGPDERNLVDIEAEIFLSAQRAGDRLRALGGSTRLLQVRAWETYRAGLLRTGRPPVEWEPNEAAQDILSRGLTSYALATAHPGHISAGAPVLVYHGSGAVGPEGPILVAVPSPTRRVPFSNDGHDGPTEYENSPGGTEPGSPASAGQPGPDRMSDVGATCSRSM